MPFNIRMGVPEMEAVWNDLRQRHERGQLDMQEHITSPNSSFIR